MSRKFQQLSIFVYVFLIGCASQGPLTGGPSDVKGPTLITVQPDNASLNIPQDQKITLTFDELLDPISIPASIQIEFDQDYKLKILGRKLIIHPDKIWTEDGIVRINISRNIRDYQKNMMSEPIQLIYSTGSKIPSGAIIGKIVGYNPKKLIELGLYKWPLTDSSTFIQKVEADEEGQFQFSNIDYGKYSIAAIEGILKDISKQIEKKNYALLTSDYISLSHDNQAERVNLLLSEPLKKLRITSIEMISQHSINLFMDNNSKEIIIIDTLLVPGDSVFINLRKSNRLGTYQIPEYSFILPEITDTLAPILAKSYFDTDKFTLVFSESVRLNTDAITTNRDTLRIPIPFEYDNEYTISISTLADSINKIQLSGEDIHDKAGNLFADSVKIVTISRKQEEEIILGGNIIGTVNYDDKRPVKVEAHKIGSESYYFADVVNQQFNLSNLPSGLYELWGFEVFNTLDPDVYFSGLWAPYHRAAQFAIYPDTIDVRVRWDVEGIIINFE